MSATPAVLVVVALETACGVAVLALVGVIHSWAEFRTRAGLAPLAGMAWTGVAGPRSRPPARVSAFSG